MKLGYLPYIKIGGTVRFKITDVDAYLNENFRVARQGRTTRFASVSMQSSQPDFTTGNEPVQTVVPNAAASCEDERTEAPGAGAMANHFTASAGRTNSR